MRLEYYLLFLLHSCRETLFHGEIYLTLENKKRGKCSRCHTSHVLRDNFTLSHAFELQHTLTNQINRTGVMQCPRLSTGPWETTLETSDFRYSFWRLDITKRFLRTRDLKYN